MGRFSKIEVSWAPFSLCKEGEKAPYPRALSTPEGLGDRLRFVAFAEKQASLAFTLASEIFTEESEVVKNLWRMLATEEEKHLNWLLARMQELKIDVTERPQSLSLWHSFDRCENAQQFAIFMANAEERGREAGEKFYQTLLEIDPVTATIFQQIALEEREHIAMAKNISHHIKI